MTMTNEEIVRDYNAAADKTKQIKILAELNVVSQDKIRAILAQAGVEGAEVPKRRGRKSAKPPKAAERQEPVQAEMQEVHLKSCNDPIEGSCTIKSREAPRGGCRGIYDRDIYSSIETIINSLPEGTSEYARKSACNLVIALFREYAEQRLGIGGQDGKDQEN